ncbi:SIS domain-containing protein [Nitrosopumilus ureiphilus]|uniref:Phosphoheptose isomerase n=1 Tax=Nitrosopumilus ureiphilus TaxID=1470067 RepID=A0A7D5R7W1_9ARCH|nr:SIS domain-containing protein [Nitrosopumilus ureiphilus]QLH07837.1 phosphoheptose isomerase [Nitrosopumilus ureiphilus]
MNIEISIKENLKLNSICLENLDKKSDQIKEIVEHLITAQNKGKTIFTMGNGGSGSTSSHFVSDLLKTAITNNSKRFKAISLVDNIPVNLAWSNDVSYDCIFLEQLKNFLTDGDIIIGFSGSGNSKNVVNAFEYAKTKGAITIAISGMSGGEISKIADLALIVPSNDMLIIESMHILICHCMINVIREQGIPKFNYDS